MDHIFWVIPHMLAGRPSPLRKPWSLAQIKEAGFRAVINLSEFAPDIEEFKKQGIDCFWNPLPTTVPADTKAEFHCIAALPKAFEFLMSHLDHNRAVLVHCIAGRDRTGLLLSFYTAQTSSLSAKQAIEYIRKIHPNTLTSAGWESMAIKVIDSLCNYKSRNVQRVPNTRP